MSYLVKAPLVLAKDQEGKVHERYEGATIAWLSEDQAKHLLGLGFVVDLGDNASGGDEQAPDDSGGKPAKTATKPVLVAWLVDNAAKEDGSEFTEAELEAQTKDALWDLINSTED